MSEIATPATSNRVTRCFDLRIATCTKEASVPAPPRIDNGDEARYADKSGTYTNVILQSSVDPAAPAVFLECGKLRDAAGYRCISIRQLCEPRRQSGHLLRCAARLRFERFDSIHQRVICKP